MTWARSMQHSRCSLYCTVFVFSALMRRCSNHATDLALAVSDTVNATLN